MEEIALISDLACCSIESGKYRIALNALDHCLTCVKKLKDIRRSMGAESGTERVPSSSSNLNRAEEENVWIVLKKIKEKLLRSTKAAASVTVSTAATAITSCSTSKRKRKLNDDNDNDNDSDNNGTGCVCVCVCVCVSPAEKGTSVVLQRPRKRRRSEHQETPDEDRGEGYQQVATGVIAEQECCGCSICRQLSETATVTLTANENIYRGSSSCNLAHNNHGNHGENQCSNKTNNDNTIDDGEDKYTSSFLYREPFRLTKSQWNRIHEYREFFSRSDCRIMLCPCQSFLQQEEIEREIELAVTSNLIFNIALSHHLIAVTMPSATAGTSTSGATIPKCHSHTSDHEDDCDHNTDSDADASWDSDYDYDYDYDSDCDDDTEDDEDVDGTECGSNALTRKQRLEGALRLYELAFTICDKKQIFLAVPPSSLSVLPQATPTLFEQQQQQQQQSGRDTGTSGSAPNRRTNYEDDELRSHTHHYLALANNCAHIHASLGRNDRSTVFRNRLLQFMSVLIDSGGSIREIVGEDAVLDGYLKSALWGNIFCKERVLAPAA